MRFQDILEQDKLVEYLTGYHGYRIPNPYADTPTEFSLAFEPIRQRLSDDDRLKSQFHQALKTIANLRDYCWVTLYYLAQLRSLENLKKIDLIDQSLVDSIADGLRQNKQWLAEKFEWVGAGNSNGLWSDVQRMNRILAKDYNLIILPEEL